MKLHNGLYAYICILIFLSVIVTSFPKMIFWPSVMVVIVKYFLLVPDALSCLARSNVPCNISLAAMSAARLTTKNYLIKMLFYLLLSCHEHRGE